MKSNYLKNIPKDILLIISSFSIIIILLHLYTNAFASYGIFRDEYYYLACSERLAAGYVDQPPLSIFILAFSRIIFGESLFAIRLLPALLSGAALFITGLITFEIGGNKFGVFLACLTFLFTPIFVGFYSIYQMNAFDLIFWSLGYFIVIRIIKADNQKLWIWLGIVIGFGLLNKISMGWFASGLFIGLILTKHRTKLKTIYPWLAFAIALLLFSPFIIWNITHDFAHLEFIRNATLRKYSGMTPIGFILGLIPIFNPAAIVIWIPGIFFFFINKDAQKYKLPAIIFIITFLILIINGHSKSEYLAAAFPIILAGGSVWIQKAVDKKIFKWVKYALPALITIFGIIVIPYALPILPVKSFINFEKVTGFQPKSSESKKLIELPQFYADMFGWEKLAKTMSQVYETIPDSEKNNTIIYVSNYGEAGAIEYYSKKYSLPKVICPHNNYWYWGKSEINNNINNVKNIISLGGSKQDYLKVSNQIDSAAVFKCQYCMPYENNQKIFILHNIFGPLKEIWQRNKNFI